MGNLSYSWNTAYYLTDEEQHKNIIKDYDMLFEYRE